MSDMDFDTVKFVCIFVYGTSEFIRRISEQLKRI